ncbi:MAG: tRNA preQ1(34) S-adenosylmethionine ribosyltransferase-isomerase QueA [Alphaproteobacteria bacterium]|jgi:S-adenosylmethionine:tRNA ribosyltransferase-isomerase
MKVDQFDFDLPRELIAARPAVPRDSSRLLEIREGGVADRTFSDLPDLLVPGDMLVFNDTRVIPVRLTGRRGEVSVEATLHKAIDEFEWQAFAKPARKLKPGDRLAFAEDFEAEIMAKGEGGEVRLKFSSGSMTMAEALARFGSAPLPPYIPRDHGPDCRDGRDYQTIYARHDGAVAAPTAGLHFTEQSLARLAARGVGAVYGTLHVGAGTFLPVKTDDTDDHRMHSETGHLDAAAADAINGARAAGGRVIAVGTTSLRLLESAADGNGQLRPFDGETSLFITPGYEFKAIDGLISNFHTPRSTLFMLVCALAGTARMKAAYAHAVAVGYRFYSFGDACFIPRLAS